MSVSAGPKGRNGKPRPLYALSSLPAEAQLKWARQQKVVSIELGQEDEEVSTGQLALDLVRPDGSNLDDADRKQAEGRYQVIAALIEPKRFRKLWTQYGGKRTRVRNELAKQHGVSARTVHNWAQRYLGKYQDAYKGMRGLTALVDRDRADKSRPRLMNDTALDLLLHLAFPEERRAGQLTISKAWEAYNEERHFRDEYLRPTPEPADDRARLEAYTDSRGHLLKKARLPEVSYWTFRQWWRNLPAAGLRLGRKGPDAFLNHEASVSYRNYLKLKPLEFVVMDHRQLDLTCLLPERRVRHRGWRLGRPWVTAAIDMRTRRWLAWKIVERPNSASIAAVLKRVFLDHGLPKNFY